MDGNKNLPFTKRVFRPDEVAQILDLSRRTVYRMIKDGRLPGVKGGSGPWRIPRETLESMLRGGPSPTKVVWEHLPNR